MKFKKVLKSVALAMSMVFVLSSCSSGDQGVSQPENTAAQTSETPAASSETPAASETPVAEVKEESLEYDVYWTGYTEMNQAELLALYPDEAPSGTVTYGSSTVMNADMFWGWTNISPNSAVKQLMTYDYGIVYTTSSEEFFVNNVVVEDWDTTDNADGSKTYRFKIHENLTFNEGTPITAKDYLFSIMLMSSPEFTAIDGSATYGLRYDGYDEFFAGDTKTFSGLKLLGDYEFSITVKAEELPYFYELALFYGNLFPVPMFVIAPGVEMTDDGNGATFSEEFTADLLRETMLDPQNGYRYNPKVTSGVYQFESFDNTTFTCVLTANPNFLCMPDGMKAGAEKIILKNTTQSTQMNELETGQVDILMGLTTGTQIDAGIEMVDNGVIGGYDSYARNGYGKIAIHCDFGPTQFESVRQALCYLIDRDEFGRQYSGGYAIVIDSRYSEAQWMYQERKDELDDLLIKYTLNTDKAIEVLEEDGWVLDANGGDYVAGAGNIRHKMVDGELMPLVIEWCSSKDNAVSDLLAVMLPPAAEQVGMKINQTIQDSVLDSYYRTNIDEPFFHIFNMGTGFATPDKPWESYSSLPQFWGSPYNSNYIANEVIETATNAMKLTDPSDKEAFLDYWQEYIVEWNRTLPDIPLYANIYHDFYTDRVQNYYCTPMWTASRNLSRLRVVD